MAKNRRIKSFAIILVELTLSIFFYFILNLGQRIVNKFMKFSEIGLSM